MYFGFLWDESLLKELLLHVTTGNALCSLFQQWSRYKIL